MNLFSSIENVSEAAQEFTPKQLEAQEAMRETGEMTDAGSMEMNENTPEYWAAKAEQELSESGESDAYREYSAKAQLLGTTQGSGSEISFGSAYVRSLENQLARAVESGNLNSINVAKSQLSRAIASEKAQEMKNSVR